MSERAEAVARQILAMLGVSDSGLVAPLAKVLEHERRVAMETGFALAQAYVEVQASCPKWGVARTALEEEILK